MGNNCGIICSWEDPNGVEKWDVIHNGPLTYDEALKLSIDAGKTWNKNRPDEYKKLAHKESPIKMDRLQQMIMNEE